jgi:hypothetical protein
MNRQIDNNDNGYHCEAEVDGDDGYEGDYCNLQVPFWVKFVNAILKETHYYLLILWYSMLVLHLVSMKIAATNK